MTDRAVSTTLSYVQAIGIITLLFVGLFLTAGTVVSDTQEDAIRSEFEVLGNRIAADLSAADRIVRTTGPDSAGLTTQLPAEVAGRNYRINITTPATDLVNVTLTSRNPQVDVSVEVIVETTVVETTIPGGDIRVSYDGTELEVTNA